MLRIVDSCTLAVCYSIESSKLIFLRQYGKLDERQQFLQLTIFTQKFESQRRYMILHIRWFCGATRRSDNIFMFRLGRFVATNITASTRRLRCGCGVDGFVEKLLANWHFTFRTVYMYCTVTIPIGAQIWMWRFLLFSLLILKKILLNKLVNFLVIGAIKIKDVNVTIQLLTRFC